MATRKTLTSLTPRLARWFGTPRRPAGTRRRTRLGIESLEDRCVPAVFTVNSLADLSLAAGVNPTTGAINGTTTVTLRSAIEAANMTPGGNTIDLAIAGTYKIALAPTTPNEADNLAGEFAILPTGGDLTIQNTSGGKVTVDAAGLSRVFDINPNFDPANPTPKFLVTLQGFTITGGRAFDATGLNVDGGVASGGGIRDQGNASLTLNDVVVTGNSATADGGGVSMENVANVPWTLTVNNSTISNNQAGDAGGGLEEDGQGKVFVNFSTISGNLCVNQGAGIWLDAVNNVTANLTVTGSLISSNTALNGPTGGIGNAGTGAVTITGSTVAFNFSGGAMSGGGGFGDENNLGTLTVLNSTFVGNSSTQNGGGIQEGGPSTIINDSTITQNTTLLEGGGLDITSAVFVLQNTIVAGNFSNAGQMNFGGANPDLLGTPTMAIANFIGGDPRLGPLQNNGGPVPTEVPLPDSPVIDAGSNGALPAGTLTDERGFNRIVNNTVDIGAVEFQPPATTTQVTASTLTSLAGQPVTFTATVLPQTPGSNTPQGSVTFFRGWRAADHRAADERHGQRHADAAGRPAHGDGHLQRRRQLHCQHRRRDGDGPGDPGRFRPGDRDARQSQAPRQHVQADVHAPEHERHADHRPVVPAAGRSDGRRDADERVRAQPDAHQAGRPVRDGAGHGAGPRPGGHGGPGVQ
jgi:hypothetical protein